VLYRVVKKKWHRLNATIKKLLMWRRPVSETATEYSLFCSWQANYLETVVTILMHCKIHNRWDDNFYKWILQIPLVVSDACCHFVMHDVVFCLLFCVCMFRTPSEEFRSATEYRRRSSKFNGIIAVLSLQDSHFELIHWSFFTVIYLAQPDFVTCNLASRWPFFVWLLWLPFLFAGDV